MKSLPCSASVGVHSNLRRAAVAALLLGLVTTHAEASGITRIIDATGDGAGNPLDVARGSAVDGSGNVYVTGLASDNAFKITPGG